MPLGDVLRLKRSHLETPSRSPKNTWVSTHQLPVLPKKNVQKENRTKKIEEIPPVGKLPTKSGFFSIHMGLSESHLCLPLKLEKYSPIFLVGRD